MRPVRRRPPRSHLKGRRLRTFWEVSGTLRAVVLPELVTRSGWCRGGSAGRRWAIHPGRPNLLRRRFCTIRSDSLQPQFQLCRQRRTRMRCPRIGEASSQRIAPHRGHSIPGMGSVGSPSSICISSTPPTQTHSVSSCHLRFSTTTWTTRHGPTEGTSVDRSDHQVCCGNTPFAQCSETAAHMGREDSAPTLRTADLPTLDRRFRCGEARLAELPRSPILSHNVYSSTCPRTAPRRAASAAIRNSKQRLWAPA